MEAAVHYKAAMEREKFNRWVEAGKCYEAAGSEYKKVG